eukprot:TRINITY_DN8495_c0_g2_i1.p1 TRINITY_DN8495_c0_g2~~TRINITY_DN8495_c0_g2_i1.p1  ORF type:complete len:267 (-),score=59.04 TRINITY_DN8495_c0_g2_i1:237-1037(-)
MSRSAQEAVYVSLTPSELVFNPQQQKADEKSAVERMVVKNIANTTIAYKVKTTAPKRYSVRPNSGILPPGASVEVLVTLQLSSSLDPAEIRKDKFLVESIVVVGDEQPQWATIPADSISKMKFRCRLAGESGLEQSTSSALYQSALGSISETQSKPSTPAPATNSGPISLEAEYNAEKVKLENMNKIINSREEQVKKLEQEHSQLSQKATLGLTQRRPINASVESLTGTAIRRQQGYGASHLILTCILGVILGAVLSRFLSSAPTE